MPNKVSIFIEFFHYILERRKFFLVPVILLLGLLAILIVLAESQVVAPFIYSLF